MAKSWTDSSAAQNFKTAIYALSERVSIGCTRKTTQNSTQDDMMMHARLISSSPKFANIIIWQYTRILGGIHTYSPYYISSCFVLVLTHAIVC